MLLKGSIMEAAQNRPSFQTYLPNLNQEPPPSPIHRHGSFSSTQGQSQPHLDRRVSDPYSPDVVRRKKDLNTKRHSMLVESNLTKEAKELNRRSHDVTIVNNLSMGWQKRYVFTFGCLDFVNASTRFVSFWEWKSNARLNLLPVINELLHYLCMVSNILWHNYWYQCAHNCNTSQYGIA